MKIILIGCGGVGKTFLEMLSLTDHIQQKSYEKIVIIEPRNLSDEPVIKILIEKGNVVEIVQEAITRENVEHMLQTYIYKGDIVVDVSYNVAFQPIIDHCLNTSAYYINTSMERWPVEDENIIEDEYYPRTLHCLHQIVRNMNTDRVVNSISQSTCVVTHGMNPGLVNHFTKMGISHVVQLVLKKASEQGINNDTLDKLNAAVKEENFALIAYLLQLRTIHCSERDTQVTSRKQNDNEFVNTWGPYSFYGEGVDPVQLGWGTHESKSLEYKQPPEKAIINNTLLDINQIFMNKRGIDQYFRSYVPGGDKSKDCHIIGMAIPHSENETTTRFLTLFDNDKIIYRPSAYYVYSPCSAAQKSMELVRQNQYKMLPVQVALRGTDIESGEDAVGSLLIFESDPVERMLHNKITPPVSLWSGTILSIQQTRALGLKYSGPTTVQVAISILSAIKWMLKNPTRGICFPEDLDHKEILNDSIKDGWLGTIFCDFVPYQPSSVDLQAFEV